MVENKEEIKRRISWIASRTIIIGCTCTLIANIESIRALPMESKLIVGGGYIGAIAMSTALEPYDPMLNEANPRLPVHVNKKIKK